MTILVTYIALIFLCRALKSLWMYWVSTLLTLVSHLSYFSIVIMFPHLACHLVSGALYGFCLPIGLLFLLHLLVGSCVHWCHIKLIWAAFGSPATCLMWHAVAFALSNFFTSCFTLLVGNLSKSTLPSVMVLDTKSSSH